MAIDRRGSQTIAGDRTWFYLLRSSAITIAGSQTIAELCFHMIADDRRPYCDLRSAIRDHMETSLYVLSSAIVCDHDRRIADDRRSMFPYDRRRSQTIADLIAICDPRSYGNQPLDRTWFYLLRSSAMIADLIAICDPQSYGNQPLRNNRFILTHLKRKKTHHHPADH